MRLLFTLILSTGLCLLCGCERQNTVLKPTAEEAAQLQQAREELMSSGGELAGRELNRNK